MYLDGMQSGWNSFARRMRRRFGAADGQSPASDGNREWIIDEEEQAAAEIRDRRRSDKRELTDDVYIIPAALEACQRSQPL